MISQPRCIALAADVVSRCLLLRVHSVVMNRARYRDARAFVASLLSELRGYHGAAEALTMASREIARRMSAAFG